LKRLFIKISADRLQEHDSVLVPSKGGKWFDDLPDYEEMALTFTNPRSLKMHNKFMAMVRFAFDHWESPEEYKGLKVKKDFRTFRTDMVIMAGYYDIVASFGSSQVKKVAHSISFENMKQEVFYDLYNSVKDVLWDGVFSRIETYTRHDFENTIAQLNQF